MKNLILALVFVSAPLAQASLLSLPTSLKSLPVKADAVKDCTDFSGTWQGSCEFNGQTQPQPLRVIKQYGCSMLVEGNEWMQIGGLKSESQSGRIENLQLAFSTQESMEWNQDKTEIISYFSMISKIFGVDGEKITHITAKPKMALTGGQLIVTEKSMNFRCEYKKLL